MSAASLSTLLKLSNHTILRNASTPLLTKTQSAPYSSSTSSPSNKQAFTYRLAAASIAKRTSPRTPRPKQDYFSYTSTDPNARPPYLRSTKKEAGEDAYFAATIGGSPHQVAFGVADGVGGWQESGIDPSEFSHGLTGLMGGTAYSHNDVSKPPKPLDLLQVAYDAVIANPRIVAGGCTASLAVVDGAGTMESANLGDSGFLIIGPGRVAFRSEAQTHAFNTPFQLSKVPPKMQQQYAIFGGATHFSEVPKQADVKRHKLKHGDIVVFATDGVWDNLSAQDTLAIITRVMEENGHWFKSHNFEGAETMLNDSLVRSIPKKVDDGAGNEKYLPTLLATAVMREAKIAGLNRRRNGPFAKEVKLNYPQEGWVGGKPDDIAVVVCVAVEDGQQDTPVKAKL